MPLLYNHLMDSLKYVRKNTSLAAKGGCICTPLPPLNLPLLVCILLHLFMWSCITHTAYCYCCRNGAGGNGKVSHMLLVLWPSPVQDLYACNSRSVWARIGPLQATNTSYSHLISWHLFTSLTDSVQQGGVSLVPRPPPFFVFSLRSTEERKTGEAWERG